jgi:TRAP-type C4-dicarboxylate transport system substrate-binding protein
MKKIFTVLLGMILAASVFAGGEQQSSGGGDSQQPGILRYAELNPDGHIMDLCADHFAELVKQKSGGRITIQVFPAGQLGDEKTVYQGLQIGSVDMCRGNTNSMVDFDVRKITLFGLPFIFRDRDYLWKALNSEIGDEFLASWAFAAAWVPRFGYEKIRVIIEENRGDPAKIRAALERQAPDDENLSGK